MARYSDNLVDQYGRPVGGATVSVVFSANGSLATLTADDGDALANPLPIGDDGSFYFNTTDGQYDLTFRIGGRVALEQFGIVVGLITQDPTTIAELTALISQKANTTDLTTTNANLALKVATADLAATTTTNGAALVGYKAMATAASTSIDAKIKSHRVWTIEDFGGQGYAGGYDSNGVPLSTAFDNGAVIPALGNSPINLWAAAINAGGCGQLGAWDYLTSKPVPVLTAQFGAIAGKGTDRSRIIYTGSDPTVNIMEWGTISTETHGWALADFTVDSTTKMTTGAGMKFNNFSRSVFLRVSTSSQDGFGTGGIGGGNLWDGMWFNGFDTHLSLWVQSTRCQNNGIRLNCRIWDGIRTIVNSLSGFDGYGAGYSLYGGKIGGNGLVGVHIGGGCGGITLDANDINNNYDNIRIGNKYTSPPFTTGAMAAAYPAGVENREISLGVCGGVDSAGRDGVRVEDYCAITGWLNAGCTYAASSIGQGYNIVAFGNAATFTGSITGASGSGTSSTATLNVTAITDGKVLKGQIFIDVNQAWYVSGYGTGTGLTGTYTLSSNGATITNTASRTMNTGISDGSGGFLRSNVNITGGESYNNRGDAVRVSTAKPIVDVMGLTMRYNQGYGVNNTAGGDNVSARNCHPLVCILGNYSGVINGQLASWSPTISTQSGTMTTTVNSALWKASGSTRGGGDVQLSLSFTINSLSGAAGSIVVTAVPVPGYSTIKYTFMGVNETSLATVRGTLIGGVLYLNSLTGTFPGVNGDTISINGFYPT